MQADRRYTCPRRWLTTASDLLTRARACWWPRRWPASRSARAWALRTPSRTPSAALFGVHHGTGLRHRPAARRCASTASYATAQARRRWRRRWASTRAACMTLEAADAAAAAVEALMKQHGRGRCASPSWASPRDQVMAQHPGELIAGTMSDLNWRLQPTPGERPERRDRAGDGGGVNDLNRMTSMDKSPDSRSAATPTSRRWPARRSACTTTTRAKARW
jgi:hypothetical protein